VLIECNRDLALTIENLLFRGFLIENPLAVARVKDPLRYFRRLMDLDLLQDVGSSRL